MSGACGGESPAQIPLSPVPTWSSRCMSCMTARPNWPRCTRSAPRCGLPGPMADRDPQRPCTPQTNPRERAGQCEGRQRERCRSRAWRCQPTFHRASKRALRDPGGSSACRRAAGRDLELLAGVAHVADDRLHAPRPRLDDDGHLGPFGLRITRPASNEEAAGQHGAA